MKPHHVKGISGLAGDPEAVDPECLEQSVNLRGRKAGGGGHGGKVLGPREGTQIRFARKQKQVKRDTLVSHEKSGV